MRGLGLHGAWMGCRASGGSEGATLVQSGIARSALQDFPFAGLLLSMTLVVAIVVLSWAFSVILAVGLIRAAARADLITDGMLAAERRRRGRGARAR